MLKPTLYLALLLSGAMSVIGAESRGLGGGVADGRLLTEKHFYILQADVLAKRIKGDDAFKRSQVIAKIAAVAADTVVLDPYYADSPAEGGLYTAAELDAIRGTSSPRRALLAYLSIGEAESYRWYWQKDWDARGDGKIDAGAPGWLQNENRKWPGNYPVKYWTAEWQELMFGSAESSLDRILAQGFDGVYLDIIDGFERFENGDDGAVNPETGQSYQRDMVDFVKKLAAYARAQKPGFVIVPQNGSQLLAFDDFLEVVSGYGQEDLFFDGNRPQRPESTEPVRQLLQRVTAQGKPVLLTEYPTSKKKQATLITRARADNFSVFIAPRALNGLGRIP